MSRYVRSAFLVGLVLAGIGNLSSADEAVTPRAGGGVDCLTCGGTITVPSEPFTCSAIVEFTTTSTCQNAVTCMPASGSRFELGTTQVYCNAGVEDACVFDVVVTRGCGCGICGIGTPLMLNGVGLALVAAKRARRPHGFRLLARRR